jgi:acyl carrier protein
VNRAEAQTIIVSILGKIAPEADLADLEPDVEFREQLDIDSMDYLNFILGIHQQTGIDVPEVDYARLRTLDACVSYLIDHASR